MSLPDDFEEHGDDQCEWCGEFLHGGEYDGICDKCAYEDEDSHAEP